jgi:hypothetical protein
MNQLFFEFFCRQLVSFYTYLLAFATVPLSYLMNSFTVSYILASDPMVQLPFSLLSMFITTLLLLSSKNVAGLFWYWSQFTLGLAHIIFRNKTFLFVQHLFEKEFRETSQNFNSIRKQIKKMKITIVWLI